MFAIQMMMEAELKLAQVIINYSKRTTAATAGAAALYMCTN